MKVAGAAVADAAAAAAAVVSRVRAWRINETAVCVCLAARTECAIWPLIAYICNITRTVWCIIGHHVCCCERSEWLAGRLVLGVCVCVELVALLLVLPVPDDVHVCWWYLVSIAHTQCCCGRETSS